MRVRARFTLVPAIALSAWVLASCGSTPDTGIRLEIDAVLMPGHTLDHVHVRTYDFTDAMHTIDEHDFRIGVDTLTVPFSMSIVPRDPSHPNMHLGIEVTGNAAMGPMLLARVHTAFIPGRIYVLPVVLYESCATAMCRNDQTCDSAGCREAMVDPTSFPIYGVDAARDVPMIDTPDVVDIGPPPMDAVDAVDATDTQDVVDVPVPMDSIDATDASDIVDAPDVLDATDGSDIVDAPDVIDVVDVADIVDVPADTGLGIACGGGGGYCPNGGMGPWICGPPELPPAMQNMCCQPHGGVHSCAGIVCPAGYGCMIDMMTNAACCGSPIVP